MDQSWKKLQALARDARGPRDGETFDVVIVGAGIGGLRAAYELRQFKPVVLERESRIGGRVLTQSQNGVAFDLGAVFAYDPQVLPTQTAVPEMRVEPARLALFTGDALYEGADVWECAACGLSESEAAALARFGAGRVRDAQDLPPRVRERVNAFFQVIHPGEIADYLPVRQLDAFGTFSPLRFGAGNQTLAEELLRQSELGPRLRLGANVEAIEDRGATVCVRYREAEHRYSIFARTVIVTTPAPITRHLVSPLHAAAQNFLDAARYEQGIVVAVGVAGADFPNVGCIVAPDAPMNTILIQRTAEHSTAVLLVYYAGEKSKRIWDNNDDGLVQHTRENLKRILPGDWNAYEILFTQVKRWDAVGVVINRELARAWNESVLHLTPRVMLGGELAAMNAQDPMPYGMHAALEGGRRAAWHAGRVLTRQASFARQYLIDATVYQFDDNAPRFIERRREGNIAFYGLILQATHEDALRDYLLDAAQDDLWEYQDGFGITAEDSALVLEGLLECDVDRERLRVSAQKLVEQFFDRGEGAFHTLRGGRARYWLGPSVDSSAHIGFLLHCLDAEQYAPFVRACAAYTAAQQQADGLWQGKWFPSRMVTSFYAVRLLARFGYPEAMQRAQDALLKNQTRRGDWSTSVIETAAAVLALRALTERDASLSTAITRGQEWLLAQRRAGSWGGEPVLYYWYELDDGTRLFYHCADRGDVTGAWAQIALCE